MPNFNGTGPNGQGPMTGRGAGFCGRGGQGGGRGRGMGRGRMFGFGYQQLTISDLEADRDYLKEELKALEAEIKSADKK